MARQGRQADGRGKSQALQSAGIDSEVGTEGEDDPLTVLVPEDSLEAAQDAIEALSEPDDIIAEP